VFLPLCTQVSILSCSLELRPESSYRNNSEFFVKEARSFEILLEGRRLAAHRVL